MSTPSLTGIITGNLNKALLVTSSAMAAQNKRILVVAENLANVNTRNTKPGANPYQRRVVTFKSVYDSNTDANLLQSNGVHYDPSPFTAIFDPNDPAADEQGYVYESNVNSMIEMADMREAGRSHEALVKAFEKVLQMMQSLVSLLGSK